MIICEADLQGFLNDRLTQAPFVCMARILAGCPLKREEIGESNLIFLFLVENEGVRE